MKALIGFVKNFGVQKVGRRPFLGNPRRLAGESGMENRLGGSISRVGRQPPRKM